MHVCVHASSVYMYCQCVCVCVCVCVYVCLHACVCMHNNNYCDDFTIMRTLNSLKRLIYCQRTCEHILIILMLVSVYPLSVSVNVLLCLYCPNFLHCAYIEQPSSSAAVSQNQSSVTDLKHPAATLFFLPTTLVPYIIVQDTCSST